MRAPNGTIIIERFPRPEILSPEVFITILDDDRKFLIRVVFI